MKFPLEKKIEKFRMEAMEHIVHKDIDTINERRSKILPTKKCLSDDYLKVKKLKLFNSRIIYMNGCWHKHDFLESVAV